MSFRPRKHVHVALRDACTLLQHVLVHMTVVANTEYRQHTLVGALLPRSVPYHANSAVHSTVGVSEAVT